MTDLNHPVTGNPVTEQKQLLTAALPECGTSISYRATLHFDHGTREVRGTFTVPDGFSPAPPSTVQSAKQPKVDVATGTPEGWEGHDDPEYRAPASTIQEPSAWIVRAKGEGTPQYLSWKKQAVGCARDDQCEFVPLYTLSAKQERKT